MGDESNENDEVAKNEVVQKVALTCLYSVIVSYMHSSSPSENWY